MIRCIRGLVAACLLLCAGTAAAQVPDWSHGPTVAFGRFGFDCAPTNDACFTMLKAGAGWTLRRNFAFSPNRQLAYASFDMTALADLSTLPSSGALSIAAGPSFWNGLVGIEAGVKLFEVGDGIPTAGIMAGEFGRRSWFSLISLNIGQFILGELPKSGGAKAGLSKPFNYW